MISIVIAYKDELEFLKEAIHSVIAQDLQDWELVLVCNLPSLPEGYDPVPGLELKYIFIHEPNQGSAFARNAGLQKAKGEFVQFLDVDDILLPGKIINQLSVALPGAVVSPHLFRSLSGRTKNSKWISDDIWCGLLNSGLGSTSSMLWHRETLIHAGGWSVQYQSHQEYELLFRIISSGANIICLDKMETIVRERKSGSITLQSQPVRAREGIEIREKMWQYLTAHKLDTPARNNAFLQYIFRQLRNLYRLDRKHAISIYKKYFSKVSFVPEQTGISFYPFLYHGFGFQMTEWVLTSYSRIRNKFLPFLPRNN